MVGVTLPEVRSAPPLNRMFLPNTSGEDAPLFWAVETIPEFPLRDGERGLGLPSENFEFFDGCGDPDKDETVGFGGTDCGTRSFVRWCPLRPGLRQSSFSISSAGLSQKGGSLIAASLGGDGICPVCDFFGSVDGDRIFRGFLGVTTIFRLNHWATPGDDNVQLGQEAAKCWRRPTPKNEPFRDRIRRR